MAYTGQTTESLKAELNLYETFIRNDCRIDNDEMKKAIERAWGDEPERMKKQLIYVLENSSKAVAEYRIQAAKEQLQMYENAKSGKKTAPAPEWEPEEDEEEEDNWAPQMIEKDEKPFQMVMNFTPCFSEVW